ncbi:MAG: 3-phenylpropionate/cinnamic acid dioxygenase subunit alpha [Gemmatimonadaceae bacterium]|nr:3-phenylpropionate/cinnamic acid dioxygenase subunit alpha [Gemmatimonadaceae bacterium]
MKSGYLRTASTFVQGAQTLAQRYYSSPALLDEEIEQLFRRRWMWVGRSDELPNAGDYLLFEKFGESVVVTRTKRGGVTAFYNVCRHRGTRMCGEPRGTFSETIQCPYHAWTYSASDGRLIGAPHMNEVEGFSRDDFGLHAASVHEWEGWIFVSLSRQPIAFEDAMAPVLTTFSRFNLAALRRVERRTYDIRANWKLILQNYNECLHCPTIHPELSRVLPYTSGANDLFEGEFLGGYMEILEPNESATLGGKACGVPIGDLPDDDRRRAYYYSLFPNMMLSIHPDYVNYYSVWPVREDRSIVVTEWMQHPDSLAGGYSPQSAIDFWDLTNRQDWHICEQGQLGIASRVYEPGPYSPRESIPAAWDRAYLSAMGHPGSSNAS